MAEDIMLAWETSVEALELRRKFDEDDDEFEDDGFTFDDDDEDEEEDVLDDEDDLDDDEDLDDDDLEEFEELEEEEEERWGRGAGRGLGPAGTGLPSHHRKGLQLRWLGRHLISGPEGLAASP